MEKSVSLLGNSTFLFEDIWTEIAPQSHFLNFGDDFQKLEITDFNLFGFIKSIYEDKEDFYKNEYGDFNNSSKLIDAIPNLNEQEFNQSELNTLTNTIFQEIIYNYFALKFDNFQNIFNIRYSKLNEKEGNYSNSYKSLHIKLSLVIKVYDYFKNIFEAYEHQIKKKTTFALFHLESDLFKQHIFSKKAYSRGLLFLFLVFFSKVEELAQIIDTIKLRYNHDYRIVRNPDEVFFDIISKITSDEFKKFRAYQDMIFKSGRKKLIIQNDSYFLSIDSKRKYNPEKEYEKNQRNQQLLSELYTKVKDLILFSKQRDLSELALGDSKKLYIANKQIEKYKIGYILHKLSKHFKKFKPSKIEIYYNEDYSTKKYKYADFYNSAKHYFDDNSKNEFVKEIDSIFEQYRKYITT